MQKTSDRGNRILEVLSFVLLTVFFVGIALIDGPKWCVDTPSYVYMDFGREPVYPLFLLGVRSLFESLNITSDAYGLPAYLTMAVVLQSLLWVIAIHRLGLFIYDECKKTMSRQMASFMMILSQLLQVMVACLNRFVAKRGSMYSESLMTESLAMPLFVLFTVLLLKSFMEYNIKNCIMLFLLGTIISSIRKQMLVAVLMWGFCSFVLHLIIKKYRSLKNFSYTVIFVVLTMVAITFFDKGYNLAVRGVFASHTGNSRGGLCTLLYTSDEEDAVLFADNKKFPELDALYLDILKQCKDQELTIGYAPGYETGDSLFGSPWPEVASHYADGYDIIGFDIILPLCDDYVNENFQGLDETHHQIMENEVEKELFEGLLSGHLKRIFSEKETDTRYVFFANILKAFVISNANISPAVLIKVSLVIYGIFLVLFVIGLLRKKEGTLLAFVVTTGLSINCVVTGALIFPQPRYMCYSMGMFYLSLFYLLIEVCNATKDLSLHKKA